MPRVISDNTKLLRLLSWVFRNSVALVIVWAVIIFILCATPGDYVPSSDWMELLSVDKLVHAGMFFVLAGLFFAMGIKFGHKPGRISVYFLVCILYGISLEIMQATWFRNRSMDWNDMIANSFGCCMALLLITKLRKIYSNPEFISAYK
jgi:VanZ like family